MLPAHLSPACGNAIYCLDCAEPVKDGPGGRWFITMGHPGFNSPANNRQGYGSKAVAVAAHRKYAGKGVQTNA